MSKSLPTQSKSAQPQIQTQSQLQSLITPDIKAQLDQFMKGSNQLPQLQSSNKNIIKRLFQKIQLTFFHFDRNQSRKIKRLLSYAEINNTNKQDEQIRNIQTKYNMGFLSALILAFLIPRGFVTKTFSALLVMLAKTAYVDNVIYFNIVTQKANTNTLTPLSQQYRNILTYYSNKKIQKQDSPVVKNMLNDLVKEMEANSKQYFVYKSKQHLL